MYMDTISPVSTGQSHVARKVLIGAIVAALAVLGFLLWSGKLGIDIGRFFASEPAGYVPIEERPGLLIAQCGDEGTLEPQGPTWLSWTYQPDADTEENNLQRGNI